MGKGQLAVHAAQAILNSPHATLKCLVSPRNESSLFASLLPIARDAYVPSGNLHEMAHLIAGADVVMCSSFPTIIPEKILSSVRRVVNFHYSPLPKYRGVRPINWALENDESSHGVTLHVIDSGIDTGPILDQIKFPIDSASDEVLDVYLRCVKAGMSLFDKHMDLMLTIPGEVQDSCQSSYYSKSDSENLRKFARLSRRNQRVLESVPL